MKIGLFSDVHATVDPVEEALTLFRREGVDMTICAGDIAGYGEELNDTVEMLRDGKLAGAALDVTATEPLPPDDELWDAPNLFITPHSSPSSVQTGNNVISIMSDNLKRYLNGEELANLVDKKLGY